MRNENATARNGKHIWMLKIAATLHIEETHDGISRDLLDAYAMHLDLFEMASKRFAQVEPSCDRAVQ